jgi:hypothetical protein
MHTDQTGFFPANSSSGNKYILVLVEIDGNCIDGEPMKDQTEGSMIKNLPDPVSCGQESQHQNQFGQKHMC